MLAMNNHLLSIGIVGIFDQLDQSRRLAPNEQFSEFSEKVRVYSKGFAGHINHAYRDRTLFAEPSNLWGVDAGESANISTRCQGFPTFLICLRSDLFYWSNWTVTGNMLLSSN